MTDSVEVGFCEESIGSNPIGHVRVRIVSQPKTTPNTMKTKVFSANYITSPSRNDIVPVTAGTARCVSSAVHRSRPRPPRRPSPAANAIKPTDPPHRLSSPIPIPPHCQLATSKVEQTVLPSFIGRMPPSTVSCDPETPRPLPIRPFDAAGQRYLTATVIRPGTLAAFLRAHTAWDPEFENSGVMAESGSAQMS